MRGKKNLERPRGIGERTPRGQRAIVQDDFAHIVDIVLNPQEIALSEDDYMGKPAVIFLVNTTEE